MSTGEVTSFGALLRRCRKVAELTQEELAERAHLSVRGISDLERGARHSPRPDTLALLIDALGLVGTARADFEAAARSADVSSTPQPSTRLHSQFGRPSVTPLVGRTQERASLERHLAGSGPPVFLLAGEPGIGKTRLLTEAAEYAGRVGFRVLVGRCHRHGDQMPYAPLLDALQSYLHDQTTARLRTELQGCSWLVRLLPELAAGPIEPVPEWLLSPDQEWRLMGQAVERFLTNIAGPAGTLLVLDDLQWAGSDALTLLASLIRSMGGVRLRVVGAYRETEVSTNEAFGVLLADLAQAGLAAQRRLGPLMPEEATDLLSGLLSQQAQGGELDAQVRERVLSRADGVPFFLVSCAQALQEGTLEHAVPWNVAQGVRQRVAALPAASQAVLSVASVADRVIPRSVLLRVVGRPEDEVLLALEGACRSGLLAERGEYDYQVTHDVIREVVEADLGAARRTTMHRQIAMALADMPGEPPVEAVAYHFARTDEHGEAARWLEQAGDAAAARFATATAMEQYLAACERAPAGESGSASLSRLHEKLGALHVRLGEFSRAREAYAAAFTYSGSGAATMDGETAARRAELRRKEGDTWEKEGKYAQALAAFDAAEVEGVELPHSLQAEIELSRGVVYHRQGNNDAAAAAANRAVGLLSLESSTGPTDLVLARAFNLQGNLALHRGDLVQAEELYGRGLEIRERIGDQSGAASSWNNMGRVAFRRGDLTRAEECFQRALHLHERFGDQQASAGGWHNLGAAARDRGDLERAEECHQRCLEISERIGDLKLQAHSWHSLGIVAHDRGNLARADDCFQRSLTIADRIGDVYTSAHTWHQLGIVARDRGALDRADECVERSLALFERLGDEHGRADCWTTTGLIAGERGDLTISAWRCRAARRLAHRLELAETETRSTLGQARARLQAGSLPAAATLLDHAQNLATSCGLRLEATQVVLTRAELELERHGAGQGTLDAARALGEEAFQMATQRGYRREEALAHRLLGRCDALRSVPSEARAHLNAALNLQKEMGAVLEAERTQLAMADMLAAGVEQRA